MKKSAGSEVSVAVVIPAYNAEQTLSETINSVRNQTHRALDIVVVDDGSKDDTLAIAHEIVKIDPRVRVLKQRNSGVAAARNAGWRSTSADLVAFLDADDLWSPDKIARQLVALESGGPQVGLVYTWYAMIDHNNYVIYRSNEVSVEGDVLDDVLAQNFIGNGSSPLVRRNVLEATGGFDSSLQQRKAQGCEDYLFYCLAAELSHFVVVPDHLVGYRQTPDNMSANLTRMLRSWILVADEMLKRHPDRHFAIRTGLRRCGRWLAQRAVEQGRYSALIGLVATMSRHDKPIAARMLLVDARSKAKTSLKKKIRSWLKQEPYFSPNPNHRFALGTKYDAGWTVEPSSLVSAE
ncbi:glycosyltransferase family 2 protein [Rhizobium leguminosarum]|uniref:Glycosyltransferase involved in cell wall biosynthesis n=1 Tax=Rhizobium leguminosarum TaxID=384 RepID=A0A7X0DY38_RHILE|nr:glycosyltransferase family A protein [Rhizobium leguminosarum]MBB6224967.1 glycosyltransferase involved in cell wall biosynthesis [Rhizobium leguminosarum]